MNPITLFNICLGLILLVVGARWLVSASSALALKVGISPLVIGLTVVAFGTSAPEMTINVMSVLSGKTDIAMGNIVGSNIFNVLFILGVCALLRPLQVSSQIIRLDVPIMIAVSLVLFLISLKGSLGFLDGVLLFSGLICYTFFTIRMSRKETKEIKAEFDKAVDHKKHSTPLLILKIAASLGLLVFGSNRLILGAVAIAKAYGVSDLVISLTIIAAGTAFPEIFTSVVATLKGEKDIAIGNVIGSNIFNILGVGGLTGLLSGAGSVPVARSLIGFDLPFMIAVAFACLPIFLTGRLIARWEGFIFLAYYFFYIIYLILNAQAHDLLPIFGRTTLLFVLPVTILTLAYSFFMALRSRKHKIKIFI